MPNNNVAIISLMAKFDEKSIEDAAKKLGKTTEEALSNVGQDKFGQGIVDEFNAAMETIKKKLKGVNLSSYTNNVLDSLFSDKDIKEKTKDLQKFIDNISNLSKSLSGLNPNSFNSMNTKQLDAVISKQEKILAKEQEIAKKREQLEGAAKNVSKQKRTVNTISKNYLMSDFEKSSESLKKLFNTENGFDKAQEKSIDNLSKMLTLYSDMGKIEPKKGTTEAIKYSTDLLTVVKEIKETATKIDLFTGGKASKFISDNFDSVNKVSEYNVKLSQQEYVKNELKSLNAQKSKLEKSLTDYIADTVHKNLQKISNETELVIDKATQKTDKLQQKIDSLKGDTKSGKPIITNIVDETQLKSLEEIENRLYEIYDKDSDGEATNNELKEFIQLYKQYEQLISKDDTVKSDPELKTEYEYILKSSNAMDKYAKSLDNVSSIKENLTKSIPNNSDVSSYKNLESDLKEIKDAISGVNDKIDSMNSSNSFENIENQLNTLDKKLISVSGDVDKLVDSFNLLSSLSLSDLQKTTLPLYNGINQVFKNNNGNHISGYWEDVKKQVEGSNVQLRELLKNVGLFNSESNGLKLISDGMENSGGIIGDDKVLIARKNHGKNYEEKLSLKQKLDEAYESGINVSRILDVIGSKESDVIFDIQEKASGSILGNIYGQGEDFVNTEWLQASDEQIKKLISDLIELQDMGINVESNLTNIMYDRNKGFSFIDLDLNTTDFDNNAELMRDHMMRIFGDLEDFYIEKNDSLNADFVTKARKRFENLSEQVQRSYAEAQNSHSPSKDFEKIEEDAVDGIVVGANKNEDKLKNVGKQMAENVKDGFEENIKDVSLDDVNITSKNLETKSLKELAQLYHELGTANGSKNELLKISEAILNIVQAEKQLNASEMQKFTNVLRGLTFVDGDSPILKKPYSVDEATDIFNRLSSNELSSISTSAIENQNKLQNELKETESQAEQTAQAVKEALSQDFKKETSQSYNSNSSVSKLNEQAIKEQNKIYQEQIKLARQASTEKQKAAESERKSTVNQASKDQLEAWKQIQRIRKEISNTSNSKIIEQLNQEKQTYQEQYLAATKILKNNSDLYNSEQRLNELKKISLNTTKQIESSQQTQLNGYDQKLSSYNSKVGNYDATINKFDNGGWTSSEYLEKVQKAKDILLEYDKEVNNLKNNPELVSKESLANVENLGKEFENVTSEIKNMTASQKGYSLVSGQKELDKIRQILKENSAMSSDAKAKIKAYYKEIESGNPSMSLDKIHGEIMKIVNAEAEAGRAGKRMWDAIKEKAWYGVASTIGTYFGLNDVFRYIGQGISTIRELDTALTEMKKVSNETEQSLKNYQATTFDTADAVGTTAKQIQNSTADWMRLGESMDQAAKSAKDATILLNVSEFEGIDEATDALVSMSQAYKDLDKMDIIDVLNNVGNNYSISTDGLATALKDSASALVTANNDLNEAVALTTAGNAITQDPSKVGAGLRTISLRLVGTEQAKQELSDLGEETDGMITTVSKLRDTIMDATKAASKDGKGFDILDSNGNYKSTYSIMQGLADLYDDIVKKDKELGTNNLNLILETIAGKNRSNIAASILQNGDMLRSVYEDAQNSEGSAEQELQKYLDSIDGKIAQLQNRVQEFWTKVIDSEVIKNGIDLLTTLVKGATDFVDVIGVLPTLLTGIGAALSFKNVGGSKMYDLILF